MAKGADHLVELKIMISMDEEKRFSNYVDQKKFNSPRLAFVHLLQLAEKLDVVEGDEDANAAPMEENGEKEATKGDKKGKGRKSKKVTEDAMAVSDGEKNGEGHGEDVAVAKEESPKKAKGRGTRKTAEAAPVEEHKNGDNHDEDSGDEQPKQGKKRVPPPKKAGKGKQDAGDAGKPDATFSVNEPNAQEDAAKKEQPKKSARGKKAVPITDDEPVDAEGDAGSPTKSKSKADLDGAPEPKKRRGKQGKTEDDDESAAPKTAANRRGMKKTTSASSVAHAMQDDDEDHPEDGAANGDAKKGGKRKPAASKTQNGAATNEPDAKPKRSRAAKQGKAFAMPSTEDSD